VELVLETKPFVRPCFQVLQLQEFKEDSTNRITSVFHSSCY